MQTTRTSAGAVLAATGRKALAALACALFCVLAAGRSLAQTGRLTVKADQPGVKISPMLYGLMTEEINHAYDGGLYAELIQNRIFQDSDKEAARWSLVGNGGDGGLAVA